MPSAGAGGVVRPRRRLRHVAEALHAVRHREAPRLPSVVVHGAGQPFAGRGEHVPGDARRALVRDQQLLHHADAGSPDEGPCAHRVLEHVDARRSVAAPKRDDRAPAAVLHADGHAPCGRRRRQRVEPGGRIPGGRRPERVHRHVVALGAGRARYVREARRREELADAARPVDYVDAHVLGRHRHAAGRGHGHEPPERARRACREEAPPRAVAEAEVVVDRAGRHGPAGGVGHRHALFHPGAAPGSRAGRRVAGAEEEPRGLAVRVEHHHLGRGRSARDVARPKPPEHTVADDRRQRRRVERGRVVAVGEHLERTGHRARPRRGLAKPEARLHASVRDRVALLRASAPAVRRPALRRRVAHHRRRRARGARREEASRRGKRGKAKCINGCHRR